MKHIRTALLIGAMVLPAAFLAGCGGGVSERSSSNRTLKNAIIFSDSLKKTFESGQVMESSPDGPDSRMFMLKAIVQDKLRHSITKQVSDSAKRDQALAKLKECSDFFNQQIAPKFETAVQSKKPEDAKAIAPLMDQLSKQLDEVGKIIG